MYELIDEYLAAYSHRTMVSGAEIIDMLLDIRAEADKAEEPPE